METVTTVTGETATDEVTVAIGGRSATTVAFGKKKKYFWFYSCFVCVCECEMLMRCCLPAMLAEGEWVVMESGLEVSVREGAEDGA